MLTHFSGDEECTDRGEPESCELSAMLGLCEINFSYNLRFCAGSCSRFIERCKDVGVGSKQSKTFLFSKCL